MTMKKHRGSTLIEVICATVLGSALLIPISQLMQTGARGNQRVRVHSAMIAQSRQLVEDLRLALYEPTNFSRATSGGLPVGIPATNTVNVLPGERVQFTVNVAPFDAQRDLVNLVVTATHTNSNLQVVAPPVRLTSQIAAPW
jgi:hypothetical protein